MTRDPCRWLHGSPLLAPALGWLAALVWHAGAAAVREAWRRVG